MPTVAGHKSLSIESRQSCINQAQSQSKNCKLLPGPAGQHFCGTTPLRSVYKSLEKCLIRVSCYSFHFRFRFRPGHKSYLLEQMLSAGRTMCRLCATNQKRTNNIKFESPPRTKGRLSVMFRGAINKISPCKTNSMWGANCSKGQEVIDLCLPVDRNPFWPQFRFTFLYAKTKMFYWWCAAQAAIVGCFSGQVFHNFGTFC